MEKDKEKVREKENTMFDYLKWRGDIDFSYDGFNKVDGMILSRFVYAPFEYVLNKTEDTVSIGEACRKLLQVHDIEEKVLNHKDIELFKMLINSRRYENLIISNYVNIFDTVEETQFSAITVQITKDFNAIIFRGTDNTIIGWKEDFNMGFISPIASQLIALDYLNKTAATTEGTLIVAGHSKGGNLAVYSSSYASSDIQDRIVRIYNYDGPGFMDEVLESEGYKRVCEKMRTFVPQGSVVGMLLGHKEKHMVVHSNENFIMKQHSLFSWAVSGRSFIKEDNTNSQSRYFDSTMKDFFTRMDRDKREMFLETIFSVVDELEEKKLEDLKSIEALRLIYNSFKGMDEESRAIITEGLKLFMESAKNTLGNNIIRKE